MELNSRMKDYYDIYYLANTYSFDGRKLQEAIFETLQNRGTPYEADTLKYIQAFPEDTEMLFKWNQYKKDTLKVDIEFREIIDTIIKFISPIIRRSCQGRRVFWAVESRNPHLSLSLTCVTPVIQVMIWYENELNYQPALGVCPEMSG